MFKECIRAWPDVIKWPEQLNIKTPDYHNGDFEGNQVHKMLRNTNILEDIIPVSRNTRSHQAHPGVKFLLAFQSLNTLASSCFGEELKGNVEQHLSNFKKNYLALDISVTSKVHILFSHLGPCLKKTRKGLAEMSEQGLGTS